MVDRSYQLLRGVLLTFASLMIATSSSQIYFAFRAKVPPTKRNIHFFLVSLATLLLFNSIDPFGVFSILPFGALWVLVPLEGCLIGAIFSAVIYSHFHAHYLSLREHVPKFLKFVLCVTNVVGALSVVVGATLSHVTEQARFLFIEDIGRIQFVITVVICDLHGFVLVYRLLKQGQERQIPANAIPSDSSANEKKRKTASRTTSRSVESYDKTLSRLKRLHGVLAFGMFVTFTFFSVSAVRDILDQGPTPGPPDPNHWSIDLTNTATSRNAKFTFATLNAWLLFTWWAWIPFRSEEEDEVSRSGSMKSSRSTHSSAPSTPKMGGSSAGVTVIYTTSGSVGSDSRRSSFVHCATDSAPGSRRGSSPGLATSSQSIALESALLKIQMMTNSSDSSITASPSLTTTTTIIKSNDSMEPLTLPPAFRQLQSFPEQPEDVEEEEGPLPRPPSSSDTLITSSSSHQLLLPGFYGVPEPQLPHLPRPTFLQLGGFENLESKNNNEILSPAATDLIDRLSTLKEPELSEDDGYHLKPIFNPFENKEREL